MPSQHAKLSPSASERWIACPASIRMEEKVPPQPESPYAFEGTLAHELAEMKASYAFSKISEKQYLSRRRRWRAANPDVLTEDVVREMDTHTDSYVVLLSERMQMYPNSILFLEERLDTGVPRSWGTSDAVIVSPMHVEIVDFKYGSGVLVRASGNSQLRLYACGAMDTYADLLGETELIRATVHQPRMNNVQTEELTPEALRAWRTKVVIPAAELALGDNAPFGPSEEACRWCPASGRCRAQLESVFATDFEQDPETLSAEEVSEKLGQVRMVRDWLTAFEEAALDMAYSQGQAIPGYKVVLSGGKRSVQDNEAAYQTLREAGWEDSDILSPGRVKGIGDLEKLLGKEQFHNLLEETGIVAKSDGRPSLVLESDKRPAIAPNTEAQKEFANADAAELL